MKPANKRIRERVKQMSTAWDQIAPTVEFKGITKDSFAAKILAATQADQEILELETVVSAKKDQRDALYAALNDDSVTIREGVVGHQDFGPDHPICEAMGFVRESVRKSGLTRKKASPPPTAK